MKTSDHILASSMDKLAEAIVTEDGVANAAIREAAERIRELSAELDTARQRLSATGYDSDECFSQNLGDALQDAWNDWCRDTGCVPDCVTIHGPRTSRVEVDFRGSSLVAKAVEILNAEKGAESVKTTHYSELSNSQSEQSSLPVVPALNALPEVTWDRWSGDGAEHASVFGWVPREDGRSDFVYVMIDQDGPWLVATSSAQYSVEFSDRLLGQNPEGNGHNSCKRVEDHFDGVNCVRLH